ncbi:MAG: hypothetical protein AB1571_03045 [Nanoarchaeota archaeon]
MLNPIKRGLLLLSLSLTLLIKTANAQASLIGTFTYMGQLIRELLYGIAAILSPILTREVFAGPFGYVYGRLLLGILVGIFVYISTKKMFEARSVANPERFAKIITIIIVLVAVLGIPDNIIYLFFFTPMFIGIIAVALALSFLKGNSRLVWALKGLVYLTIVLMLGWFGNVVGYNEISGLVIGLGSLIFLVAGLYYLFGSLLPSSGWLGSISGGGAGGGGGRGGGGPEGEGGGGIGGVIGKGGKGLWNLLKGSKKVAKGAWNELKYGQARISDEEKAIKISQKTRMRIQADLYDLKKQEEKLENVRVQINRVNKNITKLNETDLRTLIGSISSILNGIARSVNIQRFASVPEQARNKQQQIEVNLANNLINEMNLLMANPTLTNFERNMLLGRQNQVRELIENSHRITTIIGTRDEGLVGEYYQKLSDFLIIIGDTISSLEGKDFQGAEALCTKAISNNRNVRDAINSIDTALGDLERIYQTMLGLETRLHEEYGRNLENAAARERKEEKNVVEAEKTKTNKENQQEEFISKQNEWENKIDVTLNILATFERGLSSRNWDEELYNTILRNIEDIINNLERELPYVKIRDLGTRLNDLNKSIKDIKENLFKKGIRGDPLNILIPNAIKNIKSLESKLIDIKDKVLKPSL